MNKHGRKLLYTKGIGIYSVRYTVRPWPGIKDKEGKRWYCYIASILEVHEGEGGEFRFMVERRDGRYKVIQTTSLNDRQEANGDGMYVTVEKSLTAALKAGVQRYRDRHGMEPVEWQEKGGK